MPSISMVFIGVPEGVETSAHLCSVPLPNMILGKVKTSVTYGLLLLDIMNFFTIMRIQRKMEVRV